MLDDLNTVTAHECLASIEYAIERLPATARMIADHSGRPGPWAGSVAGSRRAGSSCARASSRSPPRRRASCSSTAAVCGWTTSRSRSCVSRTEGWPAAMYLAALWLRTVEDLDRAVLEFGGEHRYVAEYLSHEVLAALDADRRSLLLRVAVLGGFTAELCDAVLGRTDSAARLAELEESNMFVQSLERGEWFRVHPLFAEFAAAQLASEDPGAAIRDPSARRGIAPVTRSLRGGSRARIGGRRSRGRRRDPEHHITWRCIRNGRASTLLRWTRTLPDDCLVAHPELAGAAATAATMLGHLTLERRRLVGLASRARARASRAVRGLCRCGVGDGPCRRYRRRGQRGGQRRSASG